MLANSVPSGAMNRSDDGPLSTVTEEIGGQ